MKLFSCVLHRRRMIPARFYLSEPRAQRFLARMHPDMIGYLTARWAATEADRATARAMWRREKRMFRRRYLEAKARDA